MGQAREEFELKLIKAREKYPNNKQFQKVLDRFNKDYDTIGCKYIFPNKPDGKYVIINHDPPDIRHNRGSDSDPVTVSEEYFFAGLSHELDSMLKHLDILLEYKIHPVTRTNRWRKENGEIVKKIALVLILYILFIIALVCCTEMAGLKI